MSLVAPRGQQLLVVPSPAGRGGGSTTECFAFHAIEVKKLQTLGSSSLPFPAPQVNPLSVSPSTVTSPSLSELRQQRSLALKIRD